jgi:hypothetical protein
LREVEQRLRVADRMAACIEDPRAPDQITHTLSHVIRFRLLMIATGYENGNDASGLRGDLMFKMALDLTPSDREQCSQSTISHLETLPDDARALLHMSRAQGRQGAPLQGILRRGRELELRRADRRPCRNRRGRISPDISH